MFLKPRKEQNKSGHFFLNTVSGNFQTPSRHLSDIYQTPSGHISDTFNTSSRHLPTIPKDISQTPFRHLPTPSRHIPDTFQISSRHLPNTQHLTKTFQIHGRHHPDIFKASSRHHTDTFQTPSRHLVYTFHTPKGSCSKFSSNPLGGGWWMGGGWVGECSNKFGTIWPFQLNKSRKLNGLCILSYQMHTKSF